jgi:type IV pilus assembly protein PilX
VELMSANAGSLARQRGLSLLYALLALAALALAAVALVRSVSTGSTVAGNLAFKQEAAVAADRVVREVVTLLDGKVTASAAGLNADGAITGYYASSDELIDATGNQLSSNSRKLVNWGDACAMQKTGTYASCTYAPATSTTLTAALTGTSAKYVVFRLCEAAGDQALANCARPLASSTSSGTNETTDYRGGAGTTTTTNTPYYRIIVRVAGPRNTSSFTETIVHF